jgi:hypothetical protein
MSCQLSGTAGPPNTSFSPRYRNASHSISVQLVSTPASRRKCLPNRSCPDYLVIDRLLRQPLLFNSKEAPSCKRHGPYVVAFLASRHTVQHPRQEIRRPREGTIGGLGCVGRPIEAKTRRDSPQNLCKSIRTLCREAAGIPSRSYCVGLSEEQVGLDGLTGSTH